MQLFEKPGLCASTSFELNLKFSPKHFCHTHACTQVITDKPAVSLVTISTLSNWLKFSKKFYLSVLSASQVKS